MDRETDRPKRVDPTEEKILFFVGIFWFIGMAKEE
jgi:hypothetical protein